MRFLVILNPASCRGDTADTEQDIVRALETRGLSFELERTARPGHATEILQQRGRDFDAVVAVVT